MATRTMEFQVPKIVHEEVNDARGIFVIEPLDRGFGYTFGNSLRRVLLSSLSGAAVTSVRIEGVAHEFSTISGVKEDVTDIVLNLKGVVCRMHSDASEVEAPLVVTGLRAMPGGALDGHGLAVGAGAPAALQGEEWSILIEELELGVRSYNCLKRAGIQTVGDLISKSEAELNAIPNFGKKSIDEVIETLHARGLALRED